MKTIYPEKPAASFDEWQQYIKFVAQLIECAKIAKEINKLN